MRDYINPPEFVRDQQKKKLEEIISARLADIFELIENHLRKIKRAGLLPAGAIFVGGSANIHGLENSSKSIRRSKDKDSGIK